MKVLEVIVVEIIMFWSIRVWNKS